LGQPGAMLFFRREDGEKRSAGKTTAGLLKVGLGNRHITGACVEIEPSNWGEGAGRFSFLAGAAQGTHVPTTIKAARIRIFMTLPIVDEARKFDKHIFAT